MCIGNVFIEDVDVRVMSSLASYFRTFVENKQLNQFNSKGVIIYTEVLLIFVKYSFIFQI